MCGKVHGAGLQWNILVGNRAAHSARRWYCTRFCHCGEAASGIYAGVSPRNLSSTAVALDGSLCPVANDLAYDRSHRRDGVTTLSGVAAAVSALAAVIGILVK